MTRKKNYSQADCCEAAVFFGPRRKRNGKRSRGQSVRRKGARNVARNVAGQIIIEYILLLVVAVTLAAVITKMMVGRDQNGGQSGFVIEAWKGIIEAVGKDQADDINP